jgi:DNA repair protein RecO
MEIKKTIGVSLNSHEINEADLICRFLTRDWGKQQFVFKGIRKSKKRSITATEPGSLTYLAYYHHDDKNSSIVSEFTLRKHHPKIRDDIKKIFTMYFILETMDKTTGYAIIDPSVYNFLTAALDALENTSNHASLGVFFVLHQMRMQGILPCMTVCKICGGGDYKEFFLDTSDGRPVCEGCKSANTNEFKKKDHPNISMLNQSAKDFIAESLTKKFSEINHTSYHEDDMLDLLFNLSMVVERHYHIDLKTRSCLRYA